jgi:hypothetical protein
MDGYSLSRGFWDFTFENPEKVKPTHIAIYFFAVEHCNRLGWKVKFRLPTTMVLDAIGIKSYSVYKKCFDDLTEWGFFKVLEYSKNQYSANIIALKENDKANYKALDKALIKHITKHTTKQDESTRQSIDSINKQITNKQLTIDVYPTFNDFWNLYDNKQDKQDCFDKWNKLSQKEKEDIMQHLPSYINSTPDKKYRKYPKTFLKNKSWQNEIITSKQSESNAISEIGQQQLLTYLSDN